MKVKRKVVVGHVVSVKAATPIRLGRKLKIKREDGKMKSYTSTYWQGGWPVGQNPKRGTRVEIVFRNGKPAYIRPG